MERPSAVERPSEAPSRRRKSQRLSFSGLDARVERSPLHLHFPGEEGDLADFDETCTAATHVAILNAMRGRGAAQGVGAGAGEAGRAAAPEAASRRESRAGRASVRRAIRCYHARHHPLCEVGVSLALLGYLFILPQFERTTGPLCRPFRHGRVALSGAAAACVAVIGTVSHFLVFHVTPRE